MKKQKGKRKMTDVDAAPDPAVETEKVTLWRLEALLAAGYPLELAEQLAARHDVDLHRAVSLVAGGCLPETAAQILL